MELLRSQRGNWVIAPANIKSRTEPKICKWSPTLTGVWLCLHCCFRRIILPLPQVLWRFCLDGWWQLCKKKTRHRLHAAVHCALCVSQWCNVEKSYYCQVMLVQLLYLCFCSKSLLTCFSLFSCTSRWRNFFCSAADCREKQKFTSCFQPLLHVIHLFCDLTVCYTMKQLT